MDLPLTADHIDELIYFARVGAVDEFESFSLEVCVALDTTLKVLYGLVWDAESGAGILHYSAANGHHCTSPFHFQLLPNKH
jgi:hypothetical protein